MTKTQTNTATNGNAFGTAAYYQIKALEECECMARFTKTGETLHTAYRALARAGMVSLAEGAVRITDKGREHLASHRR